MLLPTAGFEVDGGVGTAAGSVGLGDSLVGLLWVGVLGVDRAALTFDLGVDVLAFPAALLGEGELGGNTFKLPPRGGAEGVLLDLLTVSLLRNEL